MLNQQMDLVDGVEKIAVLRANGVGDYISSLPALNALRTAYPRSEIVYLGQRWHQDFLDRRPGPIDRVIAIPNSEGVNEIDPPHESNSELDPFFQSMRSEKFDLAIQLHGGGRYSNPFLLKLGANVTVGLKTPDAVPLDRWVPYHYSTHEALRYLEVVELVGAKPHQIEPRLMLMEEDYDQSIELVSESYQNLIVINPGATDPRRRWPTERFAEVAETLAALGGTIILNGSEHEIEICNHIEKLMTRPVINLAGRLTLKGLVGLLSRSLMLISNDTGPLHLSLALGTPAVSIYWCFNAINHRPISPLKHYAHISWQLECPVCAKNCIYENCQHRCSFVIDVETERVRDSAISLFKMVANKQFNRSICLKKSGAKSRAMIF